MRPVVIAALGGLALAGCAAPYRPAYLGTPPPPAYVPLSRTAYPPTFYPSPAPPPLPAPEAETLPPVLDPAPAPPAELTDVAPAPEPPPVAKTFVPAPAGPAVPMMGFRPMRGQTAPGA